MNLTSPLYMEINRYIIVVFLTKSVVMSVDRSGNQTGRFVCTTSTKILNCFDILSSF